MDRHKWNTLRQDPESEGCVRTASVPYGSNAQVTSQIKRLWVGWQVEVDGARGEVRRFRPGLDYTVAHYGTMAAVKSLNAVCPPHNLFI